MRAAESAEAKAVANRSFKFRKVDGAAKRIVGGDRGTAGARNTALLSFGADDEDQHE